MVNEGNVSGVIDWTGGSFADPEYDVAVAISHMSILGGIVMPEMRPMLRLVPDLYAAAYRERFELDEDRLRYYRVWGAGKGVIRGQAAGLSDLPADLILVVNTRGAIRGRRRKPLATPSRNSHQVPFEPFDWLGIGDLRQPDGKCVLRSLDLPDLQSILRPSKGTLEIRQ